MVYCFSIIIIIVALKFNVNLLSGVLMFNSDIFRDLFRYSPTASEQGEQ